MTFLMSSETLPSSAWRNSTAESSERISVVHTASGIEVKIPTEILSEDSAVEFLHAEDGSVSLLIKNVIL